VGIVDQQLKLSGSRASTWKVRYRKVRWKRELSRCGHKPDRTESLP